MLQVALHVLRLATGSHTAKEKVLSNRWPQWELWVSHSTLVLIASFIFFSPHAVMLCAVEMLKSSFHLDLSSVPPIWKAICLCPRKCHISPRWSNLFSLNIWPNAFIQIHFLCPDSYLCRGLFLLKMNEDLSTTNLSNKLESDPKPHWRQQKDSCWLQWSYDVLFMLP